jgi:hypothetical protein
MAKPEPDLSHAWARINAKLGRNPDIIETQRAGAGKPISSPLASFGDVRGNVINIGSISKADLAQLLAARTGGSEDAP